RRGGDDAWQLAPASQLQSGERLFRLDQPVALVGAGRGDEGRGAGHRQRSPRTLEAERIWVARSARRSTKPCRGAGSGWKWSDWARTAAGASPAARNARITRAGSPTDSDIAVGRRSCPPARARAAMNPARPATVPASPP